MPVCGLLLLAAAALGLADTAAAGALRVSLERAGIQTSQLAALPVTTETLDGLPTGAAPASLATGANRGLTPILCAWMR